MPRSSRSVVTYWATLLLLLLGVWALLLNGGYLDRPAPVEIWSDSFDPKEGGHADPLLLDSQQMDSSQREQTSQLVFDGLIMTRDPRGTLRPVRGDGTLDCRFGSNACAIAVSSGRFRVLNDQLDYTPKSATLSGVEAVVVDGVPFRSNGQSSVTIRWGGVLVDVVDADTGAALSDVRVFAVDPQSLRGSGWRPTPTDELVRSGRSPILLSTADISREYIFSSPGYLPWRFRFPPGCPVSPILAELQPLTELVVNVHGDCTGDSVLKIWVGKEELLPHALPFCEAQCQDSIALDVPAGEIYVAMERGGLTLAGAALEKTSAPQVLDLEVLQHQYRIPVFFDYVGDLSAASGGASIVPVGGAAIRNQPTVKLTSDSIVLGLESEPHLLFCGRYSYRLHQTGQALSFDVGLGNSEVIVPIVLEKPDTHRVSYFSGGVPIRVISAFYCAPMVGDDEFDYVHAPGVASAVANGNVVQVVSPGVTIRIDALIPGRGLISSVVDLSEGVEQSVNLPLSCTLEIDSGMLEEQISIDWLMRVRLRSRGSEIKAAALELLERDGKSVGRIILSEEHDSLRLIFPSLSSYGVAAPIEVSTREGEVTLISLDSLF